MTTTTEFQIEYIKLRTLLDSLVVNTLRYCMDGENVEVRTARMASIEAELMNMIEQVGGDPPCEPGYFNCNGVCVPYACVQDVMTQYAE